MRNSLTMALAPYLGKTLDFEAARAILAQVEPEGHPIDLDALPTAACGSIEFRAERARDILPELHTLHEAHWQETEAYRHGLALSTAHYNQGLIDEQNGKMIQFTARHEGRLVGNIRMYLTVSRHTDSKMAQEDTVFLLPGFRGGRVALRFLQYMERCLAQLGVREIYMDDKVANPSAARLVTHLGYELIAYRRHKMLKENPDVHAIR